MGLGVGQRQYNSPEPILNLRSLSMKRAWAIKHRPNSSDLAKADAAIEKTQKRLFLYNTNTIPSLEKRIGKTGNPLPLVASLARISNLKAKAEEEMKTGTKFRNTIAHRLYEWESLPALDEQIVQARHQRRG